MCRPPEILTRCLNMQVEDDAFEGLSDLESLSLEDNNVLLIPATALGKLPRLNRLRLDYNRIAALSASIVNGLADTLTELGLSRNVIREIPPDVFQVSRFALRNWGITTIKIILTNIPMVKFKSYVLYSIFYIDTQNKSYTETHLF